MKESLLTWVQDFLFLLRGGQDPEVFELKRKRVEVISRNILAQLSDPEIWEGINRYFKTTFNPQDFSPMSNIENKESIKASVSIEGPLPAKDAWLTYAQTEFLSGPSVSPLKIYAEIDTDGKISPFYGQIGSHFNLLFISSDCFESDIEVLERRLKPLDAYYRTEIELVRLKSEPSAVGHARLKYYVRKQEFRKSRVFYALYPHTWIEVNGGNEKFQVLVEKPN